MKNKIIKSKPLKMKYLTPFVYALILLILISLFTTWIIFNKTDDANTTINSTNGFKSEVFDGVFIEGYYLKSEESNKGFNKLYLDLIDSFQPTGDTKLDLYPSENAELIIDTESNLKIHTNKSTGNPYFKITDSLAIVAVYNYISNASEELDELDRIRKFEAEYIFISKDGDVSTTQVSDKVFVDMYETNEGVFVKEKLYLEGYTHIPSWDRPHILFTYKIHPDKFELVDEVEIYSFDGTVPEKEIKQQIEEPNQSNFEPK